MKRIGTYLKLAMVAGLVIVGSFAVPKIVRAYCTYGPEYSADSCYEYCTSNSCSSPTGSCSFGKACDGCLTNIYGVTTCKYHYYSCDIGCSGPSGGGGACVGGYVWNPDQNRNNCCYPMSPSAPELSSPANGASLALPPALLEWWGVWGWGEPAKHYNLDNGVPTCPNEQQKYDIYLSKTLGSNNKPSFLKRIDGVKMGPFSRSGAYWTATGSRLDDADHKREMQIQYPAEQSNNVNVWGGTTCRRYPSGERVCGNDWKYKVATSSYGGGNLLSITPKNGTLKTYWYDREDPSILWVVVTNGGSPNTLTIKHLVTKQVQGVYDVTGNRVRVPISSLPGLNDSTYVNTGASRVKESYDLATFNFTTGKWYWTVASNNTMLARVFAATWNFSIKNANLSGTVYYDPANTCSTGTGWSLGGLTATLRGTAYSGAVNGSGGYAITAPSVEVFTYRPDRQLFYFLQYSHARNM